MAVTDRLVVQFDADFQRLKGALFKLDTTVKGTLDRVGRRFDRLGKKMEQVGKDMSMKLSLPIALVGGAGLKMAGDFEQGMNQVAAVSGATGAQFDALKDKAKDLGRTTQFSATEVASAMSFMAMAGLRADQILEGITDTLKLAASAQLDMGRAADIVTNIVTGFGMQTSELGGAVDVLVAAFTSANTNLSQLGFAFKYAGGVAKSTGQNFNQTTAALALMGNAGFQASMAGTALRGTLSRLSKPTSEVARAMKAIGMEVSNGRGGLVELREIIRQLEPHVENAAVFMALFGQRAGPGMLGLVRQGLPAFDLLVSKLEESGGIAQRIAEVQMKGLNGSLRALRSALEGLAIAIGDSGVLQFFTALALRATDVVRYLADLNPQILRLTSIVVGAVAVLGPLVLVLGLLAKGLRIAAVATLAFARNVLLIPGAVYAASASLRALSNATVDYFSSLFDSTRDAPTAFVETFKKNMEEAINFARDSVGSLFEGVVGPEEEANLKKELEVVNADLKKMLGSLQDDLGEGANVDIGGIGLGDSMKAEAERAKKALEDLQIRALEAAGRNREVIQIEFERELAAYREMLSKKLISAEEFEKAKANLAMIARKQLEELEGGPIAQFRDAMQSVASNIESALGSAFETGKFKAGDMLRAIAKDLALLAIRMNVLQPLFGGGPGGGSGMLGNLIAGVLHQGGIAGSGGARRGVPAMAFAGAPRFHNGGMAGLRPGEIPAILQRGEMVIPRDRVGQMMTGQGGGRQGSETVVQVINNSGGPVKEERRRSGNTDYVRVIVGQVKESMGRGDFDSVMRGRFGTAVTTRRV